MIVCIILLPVILVAQEPAKPMPEISEKERIAIFDFSSSARNTPRHYENSIAERFTYAVVKLGRFRVVEREKLNSVMKEMKLSLSDLVDPKTAAQAGKMLGAKYIITGDLRDYGEEFTDDAYVVMIGVTVKIIDVETAEIIDAIDITKIGRDAILETARKKAVDSAMEDFSFEIRKVFAIKTYVIKREGDMVYIRFGKEMGIKEGTKFKVIRESEGIKDPFTGKVYTSTYEIGKIMISKVMPDIARARIISEKESIRPGDTVKEIVTIGITILGSVGVIPLSRAATVYHGVEYKEINIGYGLCLGTEYDLSAIIPFLSTRLDIVLSGASGVLYLDGRIGIAKSFLISETMELYLGAGGKFALAAAETHKRRRGAPLVRTDEILYVTSSALGLQVTGGFRMSLPAGLGLYIEGDYNANVPFTIWRYTRDEEDDDDPHWDSIEDYTPYVPPLHSSGISVRAGISFSF